MANNLKERNTSGEKTKTLNENHSKISFQSTLNKEKTRYNNKKQVQTETKRIKKINSLWESPQKFTKKIEKNILMIAILMER
jgi:hypothetical protein